MAIHSKKILLMGATGLLGKTLLRKSQMRGYQVTALARSNADINIDIQDDEKLINCIVSHNFDCIINTCAIVNHAKCESNKELAYIVNARPSSIIAEISKIKPFKYIYISTDGYFTNDKDKKHKETDAVSLVNEYARTKYTGEKFSELCHNALIIRTNIVGFKNDPANPTFLEWAIDALKNKKNITLFDDYYTSSITVTQFSDILLDLLEKDAAGIYNAASSEVFSKKEFIEKLAEKLNFSLKNTTIGSVQSLKTSTRANSLGLDVSKAEKFLSYSFPDLDAVMEQIKKDYQNVLQ